MSDPTNLAAAFAASLTLEPSSPPEPKIIAPSDPEPVIAPEESQHAEAPVTDVEIPPELQCPLSLELMIDPVINAAGQTYERAAIDEWLARGNRTDPMTGAPLEHLLLFPNVLARGQCRRYAEGV